MRILVTGGTGFLGTHLCAALGELPDAQVTALGSARCDLTVQGSLERVCPGRYDWIFHLAAWTQAGDFCLHHPGEQWIRNQQINTNVLDWWDAKQPQAKLIVMGTSCAYPIDRPLSEENYLEGRPIESLFTYAMTKRMLLAGAESLSREFGHRYLCLVPSTLYGPSYHTASGRQMHFIFDLIRKILRGKLYGEQVELWGDGHQLRELIHVADFCRAALTLADKHDNDIVNVGAGQGHSIRRFAQLICDYVDYPFGEIVFDTSRYVGARSKVLETEKLKSLLPDLALTPLREGLAQTVDWLLDEREALLPPPRDGETLAS